MGGRKEVVGGKATEILKFMDMVLEREEAEVKKKQQEMYINYLSMVFSRPTDGKDHNFEQSKKEFVEQLKPDEGNEKKQGRKEISDKQETAKIYDWDYELMERWKRKQKGGK